MSESDVTGDLSLPLTIRIERGTSDDYRDNVALVLTLPNCMGTIDQAFVTMVPKA